MSGQGFQGETPLATGLRAGEVVTATGEGRVAFVDPETSVGQHHTVHRRSDDIAAVGAGTARGAVPV